MCAEITHWIFALSIFYKNQFINQRVMPRVVASHFSLQRPRNTAENHIMFRPRSVLVAVVAILFVVSLISLTRSNGGGADSATLLVQNTIYVTPGGESQQHQLGNNHNEPAYYDSSKIVKLSDKLVQAPQTIVTAYFAVPSKHSSGDYDKWMTNMLSLQDPMVIFLSTSLIPKITQLRHHALNRTVIIPMEIDDVPLANEYNTSFWQHQLHIDPEKRIHRSYNVFWIWLSKSWWVTQAIKHNFFDSQVYIWSDIGCFRNGAYNGKEIVQHVELIPREAMLFLAHHHINPPAERIWNNKYTDASHFFHSGSMMAGYYDVWPKYHALFLDTTQEFLKRDMFIGDDQLVAQSTCMTNPPMCGYIPPEQLQKRDNFYFGLRYVLHYGGDEFKPWYNPPLDP